MSKRSRTFLAVSMILMFVVAGYLFFFDHTQFSAKIWHWRHGDSIHIGAYEVPVPSSWLVKDVSPQFVYLINAHGPAFRIGKFHMRSVIAIGSAPPYPQNMDSWLSSEIQSLVREGVHNIQRRTIKFDNGVILCAGGSTGQPGSAVVFRCKSTDQIDITFTGLESDWDSFGALVAGIRKHN